VFDDATTTARIRRPFAELAEYLCREMTFPTGAYLFTGAGLVPEAPFTLLPGDVVSITIEGIGTLTNPVAPPRSTTTSPRAEAR
jgi:2-dehydro-3-deoxy-D-arabinonate dehydratase